MRPWLKQLFARLQDRPPARHRDRKVRPHVIGLENQVTPAAPFLVADIWSNPVNYGSNPAELTAVNGVVFFRGADPDHGVELWKSDGTEAGTVLVKDIYPGETGPNGYPGANGYPFNLTKRERHSVLRRPTTASIGQELWKSNGTEGGTVNGPRTSTPGAQVRITV